MEKALLFKSKLEEETMSRVQRRCGKTYTKYLTRLDSQEATAILDPSSSQAFSQETWSK